MDRKMLGLKLQDKIPCSEMRKITNIIDIIEYKLKQKKRWARHTARIKGNRWNRRCTKWQPRTGKRSRGQPTRRWQTTLQGRREPPGTRADRGHWKALLEGYILQQKMARRHYKEGENHLEQESSRQRTLEGIAGGLHPAAEDGKTTLQGRREPPGTGKQQTEDTGRP